MKYGAVRKFSRWCLQIAIKGETLTLFLDLIQSRVGEILRQVAVGLDKFVDCAELCLNLVKLLILGCRRVQGMGVTTFYSKHLNWRL